MLLKALPDRLGALDGGPDAGLDVVIVSLVLVLLLAPDQVSVGVLLKLGPDQVEGERRQLGTGEWIRAVCGSVGECLLVSVRVSVSECVSK